jgi:DsbC/DsbD-like thiol-disulfide interchange protein
VLSGRTPLTEGAFSTLRASNRKMERHRVSILLPAAALAAALLLCAACVRADGTSIPHGTLELIAEKQWLAAGQTANVGLRIELEKGWHVYWVNPGDSGEPPRVKWDLPAGVNAGAVEWPAPKRLGTPSIVDYGYEDAVMLIIPLRIDAALAVPTNARIAAEVKVLVCREMCIPGKAQLSLTLPVKTGVPPADARHVEIFSAARKAQPRPAPTSWKCRVADAKGSFVLTANPGQRVAAATFFPLAESQVSNAAPQHFEAMPTGFRLKLQKSDQLLKPIERLRGVLVVPGQQAYTIDVPVTNSGAAANTP